MKKVFARDPMGRMSIGFLYGSIGNYFIEFVNGSSKKTQNLEGVRIL